MYQNSTYKEKFSQLADWMPSIVESIKKDLKNEHLREDYVFMKKYLPGKNLNKLEIQELSQAYQTAIAEEDRGEEIGEFLANRWIMKHSDLYHYFEKALSAINPNFNEITELKSEAAEPMIQGAVNEFGAPLTYVFSVINSVSFTPDAFKKLRELAKKEKDNKAQESEKAKAQASVDDMVRNHERELARLEDKYEKKLAGLQAKYLKDTESLKKQLSNLQRKVNAAS